MKKGRLLGVGIAVAIVAPAIFSPTRVFAVAGNAMITVNETITPCGACSATGGAATSDPGLFDLQINGTTAGTGGAVGNAGTTGAVSVVTDSVTPTVFNIGEAASATSPTTLNQYFLSYSCTETDPGGATTSFTGDATLAFPVSLTNSASLVCTITSKRGDGGGPRALSILGSGSDTTQFMMQSLDGLYMFSSGCQQIQLPTGSTKFYDFTCLTPDPTGTVTTENYQHDQTHEAYFLGSGNGIHQICNQGIAGNAHIDFARSSRAKSASDCTGLHFVAYARDAISFEAFDNGAGYGMDGFKPFSTNNPDCGTAGLPACVASDTAPNTCSAAAGLTQFCLSTTQLQDIFFHCNITLWNQVNSALPAPSGTSTDIPIHIYTPQSGSGTRLTWDADMTGSSDTCIPAGSKATNIIPENGNGSIPLSDRTNAIFPFSFGVWSTQVNGQGGALLGSVDNVAVNTGNISNQSFPFSRFLFNVFCATCTHPNPNAAQQAATVNYVGEEGWICKYRGDVLRLRPVGYVGIHSANPVTGNSYGADLSTLISQSGFVPLLGGTIGGGDTNKDYCQLFTTP